jgi:hypothetical protein
LYVVCPIRIDELNEDYQEVFGQQDFQALSKAKIEGYIQMLNFGGG